LGTLAAGNQAQGQRYGMDVGSYGVNADALKTNAGLQQAQNQAQRQAYEQALQEYGTNWQQEQALRNMPLNELNALLGGQQVQSPQFDNYFKQQATPGTNYLGATDATGQYAQSLYNADAARAAGNNSAVTGTIGTAAMAAAVAY
jgi:hypothetical protein